MIGMVSAYATPAEFAQLIVGWNRFLRAFRLAGANDALHDRACDMYLFRLKVHVSPVQGEQLAPPQAGRHGQ